MSDFEVLQTYASWAGTAVPDKLPGIPFANLDVFEAVPDKLPGIPFANLVVFENESILRNRLFYLVPDTSSGELRCFFYLEDNKPEKPALLSCAGYLLRRTALLLLLGGQPVC